MGLGYPHWGARENELLSFPVKTIRHNPIIEIVLVEPEIPQNTGNIIRLCANIGARLHLVKPLGFRLEDPGLRRAALDYGDLTDVVIHESSKRFFDPAKVERVFIATSHSDILYTNPKYQQGDTIIFGRESQGLPLEITAGVNPSNRLSIPMNEGNRSLNLSNAVAIIAYEMWRQLDFQKEPANFPHSEKSIQ